MLPPPAASSDKLWDSSSSSSDTGDVLVRSTRVLEAGHGSVRITVQKLRDVAGHPPLSEQHQQSSGTEKQQRTKLQHKPDIAALLRAPADSQTAASSSKVKPRQEALCWDTERPAAWSRPPDVSFCSRRSWSRAGSSQTTMLSVLLSSHSAPHRRGVKVQLLDPGPLQGTTSSQDAPAVRPSSQDIVDVQTETQLSSGRLGDATNAAAAVAAAAIAAAAPLIKGGCGQGARHEPADAAAPGDATQPSAAASEPAAGVSPQDSDKSHPHDLNNL
ncbi:hypothetical protein PAMP_006310 [Pampus punctatissimus]